ncbi:MAG: hypothetical protein AABY64_09320, partial [Bdellovibrionota bacterium]
MSRINLNLSRSLRPLIFGTLLTFAISQPSQACWIFCDNDQNPAQTLHINAEETAEQAAQTRQLLQNLEKQMIEKFNIIEDLLAANRTEEALTQAKGVLDTVRIKTGIDPKIRIQESFLVPITFPENARSMNDLNATEKDQVIRTISDFRGGLYMDLMNLSKRTALLYIRAFKAQVQKRGGLTGDDRAKIVNDLISAALVPMPVEDKAGKKIIAFDQDVANEDHTYMFNRELKMYLIQDADLKISEAQFDSLLGKKKITIVGVKVNKPDSNEIAILLGQKCFGDADSISHYVTRVEAQEQCFKNIFRKLTSSRSCYGFADSISHYVTRVEAQEQCF